MASCLVLIILRKVVHRSLKLLILFNKSHLLLTPVQAWVTAAPHLVLGNRLACLQGLWQGWTEVMLAQYSLTLLHSRLGLQDRQVHGSNAPNLPLACMQEQKHTSLCNVMPALRSD